jgi:hypothetical protein
MASISCRGHANRRFKIVRSRPSDPRKGFAERPCYPRLPRRQAALVLGHRPTLEGARVVRRINAVHLVNNGTLAESSIVILLWEFLLKSHFADSAAADPPTVNFSSNRVACRHATVDHRLAPTPFAISCACPALPSGTPALATSFGSIGTLRPADTVTSSKPACRDRATAGMEPTVLSSLPLHTGRE